MVYKLSLFLIVYFFIGVGFAKGYSRAEDTTHGGESFWLIISWPFAALLCSFCCDWEKEK